MNTFVDPTKAVMNLARRDTRDKPRGRRRYTVDHVTPARSMPACCRRRLLRPGSSR